MKLDPVVIGVIKCYRRHLSSSLLFRHKKCIFSKDTCSKFGIRVVEKHGIRKGLHELRNRIYRCRDYRLFGYQGRHYGVNGQILGWSGGYDRLIENLHGLEHEIEHLFRSGEQRCTVGQILHGLQTVHFYRCCYRSTQIDEVIRKNELMDYSADIRNATGFDENWLQKRLMIDVIGGVGLAFAGFMHPLLAIPSVSYLGFRLNTHFSRKAFYSGFIVLGGIRYRQNTPCARSFG